MTTMMKYTWDFRKTFDINYLRYKFEKIKESRKVTKTKNHQRLEILKYYAQHQPITEEEEVIIHYLKKKPLDAFPYLFIEEYKHQKIEIYFDKNSQLSYVLHDQKRLYFKRGMDKRAITNCYKALLKEQDSRSPHCYVTPSFNVSEGDVMADVGAAEGILGLTMIDKVKHLYLFEPQQEWVEALEHTFAPYKEKVTIVNKLVGDENNDTQVSLDYYFERQQHQPNFLKFDIEGYEKQAIHGSKQLIAKIPDIKVVLCTYHCADDFTFFENYFRRLHFYTEHSNGYMLFYIDQDFAPPYLRRGILRTKKN